MAHILYLKSVMPQLPANMKQKNKSDPVFKVVISI